MTGMSVTVCDVAMHSGHMVMERTLHASSTKSEAMPSHYIHPASMK